MLTSNSNAPVDFYLVSSAVIISVIFDNSAPAPHRTELVVNCIRRPRYAIMYSVLPNYLVRDGAGSISYQKILQHGVKFSNRSTFMFGIR